MKFINVELIKNPMNWVVIGLMATVWLFAFHAVMTGYHSMSGTTP